MGYLLFANPNITDLLQKEYTEILTEIGVGTLYGMIKKFSAVGLT